MNCVRLPKTRATGTWNLRQHILPFLIWLCVILPSLHAQTAADREKANFRLDDFRSAYRKGVLGENREQMMDYFDDGVRLMPEFQLTIMGKRNTALYYATFSSRFQVDDYRREVKERLDIGPRVVEIGTLSMKLVLRSTRQEYRLEGKYMDLWRRSEAGELTVVAQAWNYSHPVEYSEQLKFPEVPAVNVAFQPHLTIDSRIRFEIAALNELLVAVVSHHDARIWSQFYADDGMFIYSGNPIYAGRKAIDAFLEKHAAAMPIFEKLDCRNDRIDDFGNYVVEYASHIANWRNGDSSGVNTGKAITIWRREKEGSLKIFRGMAMYD
jgi:ketosteroid isomerase-like protein